MILFFYRLQISLYNKILQTEEKNILMSYINEGRKEDSKSLDFFPEFSQVEFTL